MMVDYDDEVKANIKRDADAMMIPESKYREWFMENISVMGLNPGIIVEKRYAPKINIIFDIDHTLVFTIDKQFHPNLKQSRNCYLIKMYGTLELHVVIREGVREMLEYLHPFCNFYVYSHGLKDYVMEVLKIIDPDEKYFKDRSTKVLAPVDLKQQDDFLKLGKSISDFYERKAMSKKEMSRALIIDDQYAVIKDKDNLILSKKFLKYYNSINSKQKRDQLVNFQYPTKDNQAQNYTVYNDPNQTHFVNISFLCNATEQDFSNNGDLNQIYYISLLISRLFTIQFTFEPNTPLPKLMIKYKGQILKDCKFYFGDFESGISQNEKDACNLMKKICLSLVKEMGGDLIQMKMLATHSVFYRQELKQQQPQMKPQLVHYKFITQCYFMMFKLDQTEFLLIKK